MFALRIDIDTLKGLKEGVPRILDILSRYEMKASFFCVMGWEGDLYSVIKHRIFRQRMEIPTSSYVKRLGSIDNIDDKSSIKGYLELLRCMLLPKKFTSEIDILQRIRDEGHDLGVHGYIHVRWNSLTREGMGNEFNKMISSYKNLFHEKPKGFASPFFLSNRNVIELTEKNGFEYASFLGGDSPFHPRINEQICSHVQIPVTLDITHNRHVYPLLYYYSNIEISDKKIIEKTTSRIDEKMGKGQLASMHIHPKDEGRSLSRIFNEVVKHIHNSGYESATFSEIAMKFNDGTVKDIG